MHHSDPTIGSAFHHTAPAAKSPTAAAARAVDAKGKPLVPVIFDAESERLLASRKQSPEEMEMARVAAAYIRDALVAKKCGHLSTPHGRSVETLRIYDMILTPAYNRAMMIVAWIHLLLIAFEPPTAFYELPHHFGSGRLLPCIELLCLFAHGTNLYLKVYTGEYVLEKQTKPIAVWVICALDTCAAILFPNPLRFGVRALGRPYFFLRLSRLLKEASENIWDMWSSIFKYFILIALYTCLFGVCTFLMFRGLDADNFGTLFDATMACLFILTMANYPDVQFPLQSQNRLYTAFFTAFVITGVMFMLSLVLAVVYKSYSTAFKSKLKNKIFRVDAALEGAFDALATNHDASDDTPDVIERSHWAPLCQLVRPDFSPAHVTDLWFEIDADNSGTVDKKEFIALIQHLDVRLKSPHAKTCAHRCGCVPFRRRMARLLRTTVNVSALWSPACWKTATGSSSDDAAASVPLIGGGAGGSADSKSGETATVTIGAAPGTVATAIASIDRKQNDVPLAPSSAIAIPIANASNATATSGGGATPPSAAASGAGVAVSGSTLSAEKPDIMKRPRSVSIDPRHATVSSKEKAADAAALELLRQSSTAEIRAAVTPPSVRLGEWDWNVFEMITNVFVLGNAIYMIWTPQPTPDEDASFSLKSWDHVFWLFFLCEMIVRSLAHGAVWDWKSGQGEGWLTIISLVGELLEIMRGHSYGMNTSVAIMTFRSLRAFRVLRFMYPFHSILYTYAQTLQTCFPILGVLFCLMYVYAVVGMYWFGRESPESLKDRLSADSPFISADYVSYLNFRDFSYSLITLFHLVAMSGWAVTMNGYVAATSNWAYIYFLSFYVTAVLVMGNVVVAFTLDTFMMYSDENAQKSDDQSAVTAQPPQPAPSPPPADGGSGNYQSMSEREQHRASLSKSEKHTASRAQSKLIKLLADDPELQDKIKMYGGVQFYN